MNILGVGGWELLAILLIMLIVAGPKRMIHWSYILGQYIAKFRKMWGETVDLVQKEFDEAGVGIQIPREVPTRSNLNQQAAKALSSVNNPIKETLDEVNAEVNQIKETTTTAAKSANTTVRGNGHKVTKPEAAPKPVEKPNFGTWSGRTKPSTNYGTWSGSKKDDS